MTCAKIVFILLGYYTEANLPPIITTVEKARAMIHDKAQIKEWYELGVRPIIKPCEERT